MGAAAIFLGNRRLVPPHPNLGPGDSDSHFLSPRDFKRNGGGAESALAPGYGDGGPGDANKSQDGFSMGFLRTEYNHG